MGPAFATFTEVVLKDAPSQVTGVPATLAPVPRCAPTTAATIPSGTAGKHEKAVRRASATPPRM